MVRWSRPRAGGPPAALRRRARSLLGTRELGWLTDRRRSAVVLAGVAALCLVLALVGTGSQEIVAIVGTLALGTLIVALSRGRRLVGSVVVTFLVLCLVGTLAGPRWTPRALDATLRPSTTDTRIGSDAETPPVGTYEVSTTTVSLTQADGTQVEALLRRPVGAVGDTPGVVFLHGAGTQTVHGFREQAHSLASAGVTTLVPAKPMEAYSLTARDYVAMAADYEQSVLYLRDLDGVDPQRVGLYAESEGAYPGVVLAAEDPGIAFLVLASAPIVVPREQAAFATSNYLTSVGVPSPLLTIIPRGLGSSELPGGGFQYADFDPISYEERLTQPILMLYGTGDDSMPMVQGPQVIWDAISGHGNTQLTVRYYDGANHGLKIGTSASGQLAPGVARDLSRWVLGQPDTAAATPHVAGATPSQTYWADPVPSTRWYASGDLIVWGLLGGILLVLGALVGWVLGQLPRLWHRRGLHLPDPIGRWTASLCLAILATWVLYAAYLVAVARLALGHESNPWVSYGGCFVVLAAALGTIVILVRLTQRIWDMRGHVRHGRDEGRRWLTPAAWAVLVAARLGTLVLLVDLGYWGLFPQLI